MVLIVVLIGGIFATYAWQHQRVSTLTGQKLAADQAVDRLNNQIVPLLAAAKQSAAAGSANLNIVKIPELGVELSVPASLTSLTYHYSSDSLGQTAALSTKTIADASSNCAETAASDVGNGDVLGSLFKGLGTAELSKDTTLVRQYSNYYIAYIEPQGACVSGSTDNAGLSALILDETADLKASFTTIQSLQ
jgi:hypothetical protein